MALWYEALWTLLDHDFVWGCVFSLVAFMLHDMWRGGAPRGRNSGQFTLVPHMRQRDVGGAIAQGAKPYTEDDHVPFDCERLGGAEMERRSQQFYNFIKTRRSLRFLSSDPVPLGVLQNCIAAAGTSPSGAHCQPWKFLLVQSADKKASIRKVVEEQERINYGKRMKASWVADVGPMVNHLHADGVSKPYLSEAPFLVVMMKVAYELDGQGNRKDVYYPEQSCGIAAGLFLTALHCAGLTTLTSTPLGAESSIRTILGREKNEKVFLLMPVGYPKPDATVPFRPRAAPHKPLDDIMALY